ncbi:MAG: hypothetical protein JHC84_00305 [Solirubrobacteraceae bacterium]|nr:hypothetical protein [Solirubrobacteraceae bacterium]
MSSLTASPPRTADPVRAGDAWLLAAQDRDGAWRDYALEPGASDAWVTAVVAHALAVPPVAPEAVGAIGRAADFLHAVRRPSGWGYNDRAATDADSTSWALALLLAVDDLRGVDPVALLAPRLDARGGAHTFAGARFGGWAGEHPEVTAVAADVLRAADPASPVAAAAIARVRETQRRRGGWPAYWWTSDAYATARSLLTLHGAAALDDRARHAARQWLAGAPCAARTPFDLAHVVLAAVALDADPAARETQADRLRALQAPDGGWPPSPTLLVPPQHAPGRGAANADARGLMSTATAVMALKAVRGTSSLARGWTWATHWQEHAW